MAQSYIILGSNSSDKQECLSRAIALLGQMVGKVQTASSLYESPAWGYESENSYLNQTLLVETELSPLALLDITQEIETMLGRTSKTVDGVYLDRPIDIDILYYDNEVVELPQLQIPHPRIYVRRFVLEPLAEIAADFIDPTKQKSIAQLLEQCCDNSTVVRLSPQRQEDDK